MIWIAFTDLRKAFDRVQGPKFLAAVFVAVKLRIIFYLIIYKGMRVALQFFLFILGGGVFFGDKQ